MRPEDSLWVVQANQRRRVLPDVLSSSLATVVFLVSSTCAWADFTGRVVKVDEGDTLTVLVNRTQIRVRLDSIDAPERKQAFARRSQQSLASVCAAKTASVIDAGKDRYGRTIGRVTCDGVDANMEQVRRGMAWVHKQYAPFGSPLYEAEVYARLRQLGLWADADPVAPWEWREKQRQTTEPI